MTCHLTQTPVRAPMQTALRGSASPAVGAPGLSPSSVPSGPLQITDNQSALPAGKGNTDTDTLSALVQQTERARLRGGVCCIPGPTGARINPTPCQGCHCLWTGAHRSPRTHTAAHCRPRAEGRGAHRPRSGRMCLLLTGLCSRAGDTTFLGLSFLLDRKDCL